MSDQAYKILPTIKQLTDTALAGVLREVTQQLAEVLKECKERNMSVSILARPHDQRLQYAQSMQNLNPHVITQHDTPVVASITRTKSETF